jgi:uncharacterized peroxidase-related enzyme
LIEGETMAHIALEEGLPGITAGFAFRPETAKPMRELAEILLRGPNSLTSAEREAIAAVVSNGNECRFCQLSHSAAAAEHRGGGQADYAWIEAVKANPDAAEVSPKLRALIAIAKKVREGGKNVTAADIHAAREQGATDVEIHDTVLIAAAFSMYNRYVDGLGTFQPEEMAAYKPMGKRMAQEGYVRRAEEPVGASSR